MPLQDPALTTPDTSNAEPQAEAAPEVRPEVKACVLAAVKDWFGKTDSLTQRKNALWEYREAQKSLFPARFNARDPQRGQTASELAGGKELRRVQTPYIYRGTLQITAMSVPEDLDFTWEAKEQVKPPAQDPMMGNPTIATSPDLIAMGDTLRICQKQLLEEAKWVQKLQAWTQDSDTYPMAILKCTFRREYQSSSLNPNSPDKDESDGVAAVQTLIEQYARKDFTDTDPRYEQMLQGLRSLQERARITRWFGPDLQLLPMDAFGVMEDATDLVNIYDASAMFHDALLTGETILKQYPYRVESDGATYGVLPEELSEATPWGVNGTSTDPNSRNQASRNRQANTSSATPLNASASTSAQSDPRTCQYLVREIWCKRDRTVYVLIRGLGHYVDKHIPQKRSEQWYPFYLLAPNRVPTELYGASSVELKRDIQARIHRKRSDEEKARFLSLPRGIYNRASGVDEKEMVKLQDIKPGQLRGINFGTTQQKIDDMVQWWEYTYNPESFSTVKDEQDLDQMGALPVQALGQTGSANFATEVSVAANGSQIATQFRKQTIQRAIENFLACLAEELLQELSRDEVQLMAGAFAVWPTIYDEVEAANIVEQAKQRAMQLAGAQVMQTVQQQVMMTGALPTAQAVSAEIESIAAPLWQSELTQNYGGPEPMTRTSLFRRLKVGVRSSFNSKMDKQQNLQMLAQLAGSCLQMGQAAQGMGQPFNMRAIVLHHADLVGGAQVVDEAFPAISPLQIAQQLAAQAISAATGPGDGGGKPGGPPGQQAPSGGPPAAQGEHGNEVDPAQQAQNAVAGAPDPAIG
jgi:hypothetical protein